MAWLYVILAIIVIALVIVIANLKIVPQSKAYVIERLGAYLTTWQTGFHVKIPFFERIAKVVSLKEQVVDFAPQPVITKDNVTMQIDTVVFFQITDPKLYTYGVEHPISAIENLSATTLRNIIGEMELDATLTSRDTINAKIRVILDEATAFADPDNEVKIQKALNELSKSKTVIMIAHRLSTVQNANCIYVFKDGRLIEQGESGELCKQNGVFATMLENYLTSVKWKVAKEELK